MKFFLNPEYILPDVYGKRESKKLELMIEPEQFGKIPDLEFFACLLDGRTLKVRIPYIHVPKEFEFNPLEHQYAVPFAA
ncbi:hypothetical protein [Kangiella sp.]|uniref:hypothetical protein n=1 Tax=Kangiella sp. TaxID=1920245 RepID=UPI00199CB534|nr:hypothetical protein [Kangiella sp.]MBD3654285.1 hypothetical protein [Kangiella sp.]